MEFDVDDVDAAAAELQGAGYALLHEPKTMPWGQQIVHVLSPERLNGGHPHSGKLTRDSSSCLG